MSQESLAAVQTAWKRLVEEDVIDVPRLRAEVASSWRRCRDRRLDPLQRQSGGGDWIELEERLRLKDELLRAARPFLDGLHLFVKGDGFQVILADEEGVLLEVLCDGEALFRTGQSALRPGDDWSEAERGTNAIGTAIAEKRPVQISACEHFLEQHHSLTCSAAPIFDPEGKLTGVLDISCDYRYANDHTLGMVVVAVNGIESQLRLRRSAVERLRREYPHSETLLGPGSGWPISDPNLIVIPQASPPSYSFDDIIGESPAIESAKELAREAAAGSGVVLISGESGTGKELFARAIHQAGEGSCHPFVVLNCTALPEHRVEGELFCRDEASGAEPGNRPVRPEIAGGTIFLREVGDLSLPAQLKLLRVLRDIGAAGLDAGCQNPGAVRIIAATQKDLEAEVRQGRFSPELFGLLGVVRVRLAPLRERGEDLSLLCRHLALKLALQLGRDGIRIEESFLRKIRSRRWPGNVRELENALEWAVMRAGTAGVLKADLLDGPPPLPDPF